MKGIIFDMDGTMFDTEIISVEAMQNVAVRYGVSVTYDDALEFLGLPSMIIREKFLQKFGQSFPYDKYRQEKIVYQNAVIQDKGVPFKPGLHELLRFAKDHDIRCAVATSTSRERTEDLLFRADLSRFFDVVICGEDVKNGKPNPDIFVLAAKRMGLTPEDCMVIEDSRNGILAASRSDAFAVLVPDLIAMSDEMHDAADMVCKDLYEVLGIIKEENAL